MNHRDDLGNTPLHHAAGNGFARVTACLLAHPHVVVDPPNAYGATPAMLARMHHHNHVARMLDVQVRVRFVCVSLSLYVVTVISIGYEPKR